MRFKNKSRQSDIPEVNLVPMMDVLMTVLTFFIIISMTLTGTQVANVRLPQSVTGADEEATAATIEPLIVGLDKDGNLVLDNQRLNSSDLAPKIRSYFSQNPEGKLILKADRELSYQTVAGLLSELRAIGGNRVSLAVE
ncbi:MAG TPA: biopolymer transporter ExbD [Trichocoleus sp.]